MRPPDRRLDEVLHAAHLIDICLRVDRGERCGAHKKVGDDLGPMIGVVDWTVELHRLLNGGQTAMEELKEELRIKDPNRKQIGGTHYGGGIYQHWDLMIDTIGPGYLVGCATKYLARAKNPLQDTEKAIHYIEKLESLYVPGGKLDGQLPPARSRAGWSAYCKENCPTQAQQDIFLLLLGYTTLEEIRTAKRLTVAYRDALTR